MTERICERCGTVCAFRGISKPEWHRVKLDIVALVLDRTLCQECSVELGRIVAEFFGITRKEPAARSQRKKA